MPELDWLFTPILKSEKCLHTKLLQASTRFYPRFTLPKYSSLGFGSYSRDLWHFDTTPLITCGILRSLWIPSYESYPCHTDTLPGTLFKEHGRTPKGPTLLLLLDFRFFELPGRGSFQRSLTVLVRYRTRNVLSFGG